MCDGEQQHRVCGGMGRTLHVTLMCGFGLLFGLLVGLVFKEEQSRRPGKTRDQPPPHATQACPKLVISHSHTWL